MQPALISNITGIKNKSLLIKIAIFIFFILFSFFPPVWFNASRSFHLGEKFFQTKEFEKAIPAFEQSILHYFPFSPYHKKAIKCLFTIGDLAFQQQNIPIALQAYHAILFSKASLSVYRNISQEDSRLAMDRLIKISPEWIGPIIPKNFPNRLWSLGMGIFLLGWIGSVFVFIQTGFDKNGKIKKPAAYYPLGLFIITFFLWLTSIINL